MSNLSKGIWPPLVFPGPLSEATSKNGGTASPSPAPPTELPSAASTDQNWSGAASTVPVPNTTAISPQTTQAQVNAVFGIVTSGNGF